MITIIIYYHYYYYYYYVLLRVLHASTRLFISRYTICSMSNLGFQPELKLLLFVAVSSTRVWGLVLELVNGCFKFWYSSWLMVALNSGTRVG